MWGARQWASRVAARGGPALLLHIPFSCPAAPPGYRPAAHVLRGDRTSDSDIKCAADVALAASLVLSGVHPEDDEVKGPDVAGAGTLMGAATVACLRDLTMCPPRPACRPGGDSGHPTPHTTESYNSCAHCGEVGGELEGCDACGRWVLEPTRHRSALPSRAAGGATDSTTATVLASAARPMVRARGGGRQGPARSRFGLGDRC